MVKPNTKLYFGPYKTPRYKYGQIVMDDCYGEVKIIGTSDAKIPWPTHRGGTCKPILVLYKDLARAVRSEMFQAVRHHWGVSIWTVDRWRKALQVPTTNKTTHLARAALWKKNWPQLREAIRPSLSSPERAAKISAAMRGKARPKEVADKLRKAFQGRKHTIQSRTKMSAAQKRRGAWPPSAGNAWSAEEDQLLRTLPISEVVKRTKRTLIAVRSRRLAASLLHQSHTGYRWLCGSGSQVTITSQQTRSTQHCAGHRITAIARRQSNRTQRGTRISLIHAHAGERRTALSEWPVPSPA